MAIEVHLSQFDGPLDLLLHLIEQARLDIKDIFVSEITNQYLALMREVDSLDMDTASEFLSLAATLLLIKSRSLLPKPPKEELAEEDPEAALVRQLREYKAIKQARAVLEELMEEKKKSFFRLPEEYILPPQEYSLEEATTSQLYEAFFAVLNKSAPKEMLPNPLHQVRQDTYTVRTQLIKIRSALRNTPRMDFESLFEEDNSKIEKIVTFMALLDMIMRNEVTLKQNAPYMPILIIARELLSDDVEVEYMDE